MNETNISLRQKLIVNLISQANGLSREAIQKKIAKFQPASKPTLIRDLNLLTKQKLIRIAGRGKNTKYFAYSKNPLLAFFDLDAHFLAEPDERKEAKKSFDFGIFNHLNNLFSVLEFEELKKGHKKFTSQTKKLNKNIFAKELERFIIELSWKSSKIEGNTYTLLETEALIKKSKSARGHSKQEATMILNHKLAFELILKNKKIFKKLTVSRINQLHNLMTKGLNISPGIRKQAVGITGTVYKPLDNEHQIKEALNKLIQVINKNQSVVEKALIIKAMISYIQPYADGNKRTARMLTNAILLAHDYYPLSYRSLDEEEFKKALILFYEQNSLYHLKRLFIEQLRFAWENYFR